MSTTLFLVRHAPHVLQHEVFVGRTPGVPLAPEAARMLERLCVRFAGEAVDAVHASPVRRAQETAAAIAAGARVEVTTVADLDELELGEWTGRPIAGLRDDPAFTAWSRDRSVARPPRGESLLEAQLRMVRHAEMACAGWPDGRVVLVGHGDPLKCLIAHYLALPIVNVHRFDLEPASVSALVVAEWGAKLLFINERTAA